MQVLVFWLLLTAALYSYLLYPIALKLLVSRVDKSVAAENRKKDTNSYRYSLIVTVYNEKERIRSKLANLLELDFDSSRLELIVASDGSDDGTDDIVREFEGQGVRLVRAQERLGKENAQLAAIQVASGDVLVFSDVATVMESDALRHLEPYFNDPSIGAVSSEDRLISKGGDLAGEGAYVKYEMWLRQQESRLGGLVGLSGSFFAARAGVCKDWDIYSPSDFNTALNCAKSGLRSVSAPDVLGFYEDLKDPSKEYARKVRTVLRGMTGLSRHKEVLNVARLGAFSFQVFSHKVMRWGVPWFLIALLVASVVAANDGWFYQLALLGQVLFYLIALFAHLSDRFRSYSLVKLIYFFVQVNIAQLDAAIKFFSGTRMSTWKPSSR